MTLNYEINGHYLGGVNLTMKVKFEETTYQINHKVISTSFSRSEIPTDETSHRYHRIVY
jgi:hypothetical protein